MAIIATGITVTGTGWTGNLIDVSTGWTREAIPTTHQGSTQQDFAASTLADGGNVTMNIAYAGTEPTYGAEQTITIAWPAGVNSAGGVIAATSQKFKGFLQAFDSTSPLEGRATARVTFKVSGQAT